MEHFLDPGTTKRIESRQPSKPYRATGIGKRLAGLLLATICCLCVTLAFDHEKAAAVTESDIQSFFNSYKANDFDGSGGLPQCVDFYKEYLVKVWGGHSYSVGGYAYKIAQTQYGPSKAGCSTGWTYIAGSSLGSHSSFRVGDVAVFGQTSSDKAGHVAVVASVSSGSVTFREVYGSTGKYVSSSLKGSGGNWRSAGNQPLSCVWRPTALVTSTSIVSAHIPDGLYTVASSVNRSFVLDVSNNSKANCANVQVWTSAVTTAQHWRVKNVGGNKIQLINVGSGRVLDVSNGSASNGANVWQYDSNGTNSQLWIPVKQSDGSYMLHSALNTSYVLDLSGGVATNGRNVQVWSANTSAAAQKWFFNGYQAIADGEYTLSSVVDDSLVLDIASDSSANGVNVQMGTLTTSSRQRWRVSNVGNGRITLTNVTSGRAADVSWGSTVKGTNVWQYQPNSTDSQAWIPMLQSNGSYVLYSALGNDLALDIYGGYIVSGQNVQVWSANGTNAQQWKFYSEAPLPDPIDAIAAIPDQVYTGTALEPELTVTAGGTALVAGTDYTVSYKDNEAFGTATATVTGVGKYTGTASTTFRIVSHVVSVFHDVSYDDWFVRYGALDYSYAHSLVMGYGGTNLFGSEDDILRRDVAVILWRMAGEPVADASDFEDVDYSDYYGPAIEWARSAGVVNGDRDADGEYRRFRPDDSVSRQELACMVANYAAKVSGVDVSSDGTKLGALPDAGEVAGWAAVSVGWCMDAGVLSGVDEGGTRYMRPLSTAKRPVMASMATALHRDVLKLG